MLSIYIITPFPEVVNPILNSSILNKAKEKKIVRYEVINLFDFLDTKTDRIDDYPFGGYSGMLLKPVPILNAINSINVKKSRIIFPTPDGKLFNHDIATEFSKEQALIFICGHYKGIDQRIRDNFVTDEISIGDFVMTGGELPSLMMIDSVIRLKKGVLGSYQSAESDSFFSHLLDGPYYTRPRSFDGLDVPEILLSGNHKKIENWFIKEKIKKTKKRRSDLWKRYKSENSDGE